ALLPRADRVGGRSAGGPRGPGQRGTVAPPAPSQGTPHAAPAILQRDDPERDRPGARDLPDARLPPAGQDAGHAAGRPSGRGAERTLVRRLLLIVNENAYRVTRERRNAVAGALSGAFKLEEAPTERPGHA